MKRQILRAATVVTILATCVSATSVAANADDGPSPLLDGTVEIAIATLTAATSICNVANITFTANDEPSASPYYGVLDSKYEWTEGVVVEGCTNARINATATLTDQPLDGYSGAASGSDTQTGMGRVVLAPRVVQTYDNVDLATGRAYHSITLAVHATQSYGTMKASKCVTKTWTYEATLAGPIFVGSTPMTACA